MVGWYFFLWGMSGLHFAAVGPFIDQAQCEVQRIAIIQDTRGANQVSKQCIYTYAQGVRP